MNKALKTILIISIAVFGIGFLLVSPTNAQVDGLVIEYWTGTEWLSLQGPIFDETNFLPGEDVTRLVRVTNNSGQSQRIATEAINKSDPNRLGDVLNLEIKEGGVTRYDKPLSTFFNEGEVFLSNLAGNGTQTQYDFIVSFYSGAGNPFQGKSLTFDILVGFQGTEGGILPGAGGGAGGFLPPGLTIPSESIKATEIGETSVTITWTTSYLSTSQVIYGTGSEAHTLDLSDNTGTPPKYGYAHTTLEYDISSKVTFHSVTIYDLTPGTTYYYRAVSHASLAISQEYNFITKGVKGWEIGEEGKPAGEIGIPEITGEIPEEITEEGIPSAPLAEGEIVIVSPERGLASMVAAIGMVMGEISQSAWKMIVVILNLIGLVLIGIREWELARKKKRT